MRSDFTFVGHPFDVAGHWACEKIFIYSKILSGTQAVIHFMRTKILNNSLQQQC